MLLTLGFSKQSFTILVSVVMCESNSTRPAVVGCHGTEANRPDGSGTSSK